MAEVPPHLAPCCEVDVVNHANAHARVQPPHATVSTSGGTSAARGIVRVQPNAKEAEDEEAAQLASHASAPGEDTTRVPREPPPHAQPAPRASALDGATRPRERRDFEVHVHDLSGSAHTVRVYPELTIDHLKTLVALRSGLDKRSLRLFASGHRAISDTGTVSAAGIEPGERINVATLRDSRSGSVDIDRHDIDRRHGRGAGKIESLRYHNVSIFYNEGRRRDNDENPEVGALCVLGWPISCIFFVLFTITMCFVAARDVSKDWVRGTCDIRDAHLHRASGGRCTVSECGGSCGDGLKCCPYKCLCTLHWTFRVDVVDVDAGKWAGPRPGESMNLTETKKWWWEQTFAGRTGPYKVDCAEAVVNATAPLRTGLRSCWLPKSSATPVDKRTKWKYDPDDYFAKGEMAYTCDVCTRGDGFCRPSECIKLENPANELRHAHTMLRTYMILSAICALVGCLYACRFTDCPLFCFCMFEPLFPELSSHLDDRSRIFAL